MSVSKARINSSSGVSAPLPVADSRTVGSDCTATRADSNVSGVRSQCSSSAPLCQQTPSLPHEQTGSRRPPGDLDADVVDPSPGAAHSADRPISANFGSRTWPCSWSTAGVGEAALPAQHADLIFVGGREARSARTSTSET